MRIYIRKGKILNCVECEKEFYASPSVVLRGKKYCSHICYLTSSQLLNRLKEIGVKIGDKSRKKDQFQIKNLRYWKGKKLPKYVIKKLSDAHKGKQSGANNPAWKGGIRSFSGIVRSMLKYIEWRKSVFHRDEYICQECFNKGGYLQSHHKKSFELIMKEFTQEYNQFSLIDDRETLLRLTETYKPLWDLNNGITLCKKCHMAHNTRGIRNEEIIIGN